MTDEIYYKTIWSDEQNLNQIRVTVNDFKGVEYLHIRKYFLSFDGDWCPSNVGVSMPIDFNNIRELFVAVSEVISLAESREVIKEYFGDIINNIYK